MAFDYGSIDLGLKNPFKKEGLVKTIRGVIATLIGVYILITAASSVKSDPIYGWILVVFGIGMLGSGIATSSNGIMAMLRYFVGRNHPTSLARNFSRSESSTAAEELGHVAYTKDTLVEMLMGRKNSTFIEPDGFLARFIHTMFKQLTYMPYPVRNLAQRLLGAWVTTIVALISYGLVAFVSLAGFAGDIGEQAFPVYSVVLALYLALVWSSAGKSIARTADRNVPALGGRSLVNVIAGSLIVPVVVGFGASSMLSSIQSSVKDDFQEKVLWVLSYIPDSNAGIYIVVTLVGASITTALIGTMLRKRLLHSDPKVEVSEMRENWQETVHPNDIFINLDNLVMANRRYKEVPNRVYQDLEPVLSDQTEGKGSFIGEMIQEIQPRFKDMALGNAFNTSRLISLVAGHGLFLIGTILTAFLAFNIADTYKLIDSLGGFEKINDNLGPLELDDLSNSASLILHLFFAGFVAKLFARLLANASHLFYAEMQFESNLIYFKCEGTYTESKISTGTGIYDSTRSENVLVRSSITPWVIVTRIVSSTFAATGMRNLEHPRYILEMHKSDNELAGIKADVIDFLRDRESIASITSNRDLENASQIHQINQSSRAAAPEVVNSALPADAQQRLTQDAEAAGYLAQEAELTPESEKSE